MFADRKAYEKILKDYGIIKTKGYQKLLAERDGSPSLIDNPNWKQGEYDNGKL